LSILSVMKLSTPTLLDYFQHSLISSTSLSGFEQS